MKMQLNTIGLTGTVAAAPEPYHNVYGRGNVYALYLDVARDSGIVDRILVLFQENKIEGDSFQALPGDYMGTGNLAALIKQGSRIEVTGAIQTYKDNSTGHTQLFVWARYLAAVTKDAPPHELNTVYIDGEVAKEPIYRETPKGQHITEIVLRVPSEFTPGFYSFVPCITWNKIADWAKVIPEGAPMHLEGRLQSRNYRKNTPNGTEVKTTWEISACKLGFEFEADQEGDENGWQNNG